MAMWARVVTSETPVDKVDFAIKTINDEVMPAAKKIRGLKGAYWLGDRTTGKGIAVFLYESEQTLKEAEDVAKELRKQTAEKIGLTFHSVDRLEVLASF
jgi:hypothetical protein